MQVTRREFLNSCSKAVVAVSGLSFLPAELFKPSPKVPLPDIPWSACSLDYQAVGRKLLFIEELPQGALARYERDVAAIGHAISKKFVEQ